MTAPLPADAALDPMCPRPFRVARRRKETDDTVTLTVAPCTPGASACFAPGQFNMLYAFGVGEVPVSVSARTAGDEALEHTIRAVGRTTEALCRLRVGDVLGVRGPFGRGWPLHSFEGRDVVLIAGGIGLAPLRPVVRDVLEHRAVYGRLVILYGARTPEDRLFRRELDRWAAAPGTEVHVTVDRASGTQWRGPVGVVPRLLVQAGFDPGSAGVFLCGPEVMIEPCVRELVHRGLAPDRVYVSLERNMHCAIGLCGHCQLGPDFICKDGPVFALPSVTPLLRVPEL